MNNLVDEIEVMAMIEDFDGRKGRCDDPRRSQHLHYFKCVRHHQYMMLTPPILYQPFIHAAFMLLADVMICSRSNQPDHAVLS